MSRQSRYCTKHFHSENVLHRVSSGFVTVCFADGVSRDFVWLIVIQFDVGEDSNGFVRGRRPDDTQTGKSESEEGELGLQIEIIVPIIC